MTDILLVPTLLGAVLGVLLCAVLTSRKRRASFWHAVCIGLVAGICAVLLDYGASILRESFWTQDKAPGVEVVPCVFGLGAFAAFVSSATAIGLYRYRARRVQ